jgi:glycosyltransferase involved in cell wall biosynthesis
MIAMGGRIMGFQRHRAGTVHVVQRMAPGGIETLVLDLVRRGSGDDCIFSLEGTTDELIERWPALESSRSAISAFDRKQGLRPAVIGRLAARLRAVRPRMVVVHHIGPLVYGGPAARLAGVARLVHVEHDVWHYANARARVIVRSLSRLVRPRHVAVSHKAAAAMRKIIPRADVLVIPPAIDTNRFLPGDKAEARARLGLDPNLQLVGTAGRLVPVKNHEILIDAMPALPERTHVVVAGEGPELSRLKARAEQRGVIDRLHFLGHREDLERVLPAFDVFCLPSHAEGLPRTVLEAQACGLPVVASNVGALDEAICPRTGVLVPPCDLRALAGALQRVLAEPEQWGSPRAFIEQRFGWNRTLSAYRGLMEA